MKPKTLYDKIIDAHIIRQLDQQGNVLLYIDRSILNEYTSPQALADYAKRNVRSGSQKVFYSTSITLTQRAPAH